MLGYDSVIENTARTNAQPLLRNTLTEILGMLLLCLGTQQNPSGVYGIISTEKNEICFYSLKSYFQNHKSQIMGGALTGKKILEIQT